MKFSHKAGDAVNNHEILLITEAKRKYWSSQKGKQCLDKDPRVLVKCLQCGFEKEIHGSSLKYVKCHHGPCSPRFQDISGQKRGKLLILKYIHTPEDRSYKWKWLCKCGCGNEEIISQRSLKAGKTQCLECMYTQVADINRLEKDGAAWNRQEKGYMRAARKRNLSWNLSSKEFKELCGSTCHYCGTIPTSRANGLICNGIDRTDNTKGYTATNCVPCCKLCNFMKKEYTVEHFISHVLQIASHQIN